MGARDLSFLSCRAYGKLGRIAVIRLAEEVLQAFIMIKSSIKPSLMSLGRVDWRMNTNLHQQGFAKQEETDHLRREQIHRL